MEGGRYVPKWYTLLLLSATEKFSVSKALRKTLEGTAEYLTTKETNGRNCDNSGKNRNDMDFLEHEGKERGRRPRVGQRSKKKGRGRSWRGGGPG